MSTAANSRRRGGPIAVLAVLLGVWVAGRAAIWEDPFPIRALVLAEAQEEPTSLAVEVDRPVTAPADVIRTVHGTRPSMPFRVPVVPGWSTPTAVMPSNTRTAWSRGMSPAIAAGHQFLMAAAFSFDWSGKTVAGDMHIPQTSGVPVNPAFPSTAPPSQNLDRWSLDGFAFFREGSSSLSSSQGRVPVYGASQIGANAQYRIAPASPNDPRAFVRAYRALVSGGETEVAAGLSARPLGAVPVRLAAEMRVTDNQFRTEIRPAASLTTELPPVPLPAGFNLEAFAGAGYVGGEADTYFADGQASVTREVGRFEGVSGKPVRLSLGAGTWGGAQEDARRLDVGPTVRVDLTVGEVPARISVDWRERVAGDAAPTSGIAATLSTRF